MNFKNFNVVQPQEQPKEEVNSAVKMANISIRVDANCFLLCDGEFTEIELQAGKITKVQLPIGQHLLEFVDIEFPELKMEKVVDWPDEGKSYLVLVDKFKEVIEKAKAEAERKAKEEAKRKAKEEEAERNKPIKYEVEDCIYELYPAKYTAALIKSTGTGENIVVLETISYLDNDYSVTAIGNSAFKNCSSLESIDIPDGVKSIGEHAFYNCSSLTYIDIPDSVTSIGGGAFSGCSSLKGTRSYGFVLGNFNIPEGVTSIEAETFYNCSSLIRISIPNSVTSIGAEAFYGCSYLSEAYIGNSVKSIGAEAFYGCDTIETIHYEGTKAQWKKISLGEDWNLELSAEVVHCTDGDVEI